MRRDAGGMRGPGAPGHAPEPDAPAPARNPARRAELPGKLLISSKGEAQPLPPGLMAPSLPPISPRFDPALRFQRPPGPPVRCGAGGGGRALTF